MKRATRRGAIAVLLASAVVAAGCGGSSGGEGSTSDAGNGVVVGVSYEPSTLDVQVSDSASLAWNINEGLVEFDESNNLVPLLAEDVPQMVEGDPLRWRVQVRDGITFTDGEPVDAEAVKFNIDRIIDPGLDSQVASPLMTIDSVEVVDDRTVEIVTAAPDPILDYRLAQLRLVSPAAAEGDDYAHNPVGTGPYVLDEWTPGDDIVLTTNPDYWGDAEPQVERVEFRFIPDGNTRLQALQAGDIDMAQDIPADQTDNVPAVLRTPVATNSMMIRLGVTEPPFDDVKFRQALAYAIDWETINDTIANGQWNMNRCQPVIEGSGGFNPDLEPYPYDPDRARELLAEVDIPEGFTVPLTGTTGVFPKEHEIQQAIASYWEEIGLSVDLQYHDLDPFLREYSSKTNLVLYNDTDQSIHHGARQLSGYFGDGEGSVLDDTFPDLNAMVERAMTSLDEGERGEAYNEVWQYACDNALFIYGLDRPDIWGTREGISYPDLHDEFDKMRYSLLEVSAP